MRNYASKCNRRVTRYRTSSTFKARQSEAAKRVKFSLPSSSSKTLNNWTLDNK